MRAPTAMAAPHTQRCSDPALAKAELRAAARLLRQGCDPARGEALAARVLAAGAVPPGVIVAGAWPLPGEIDLRPLLRQLHDRGHTVVLPETPAPGGVLHFRHWTPDCRMQPGRFGTFRPDGPEHIPDLLFVPLLAFDRHGHRLGYGGGYYDRTLATLPGRIAIGYGFAAQEVASVPIGPHDVPLDLVATEQEIITPARECSRPLPAGQSSLPSSEYDQRRWRGGHSAPAGSSIPGAEGPQAAGPPAAVRNSG